MATQNMQYACIDDAAGSLMNVDELASCSKSLYVSHFFSTWNSRGFEFGAILFLSTIYPRTLLPLSIYALVRSLAAITFSPMVGKYIDSGNRLAVVRISILGQRLAVASSCAAFLYLFLLKGYLSPTHTYALLALLILLACIEKICIIMNTIAIERDWVVVIAGQNEGLLQEMNLQMRRIDLFCKLISPLTIALLDGFSSTVAVYTTLVLNTTSVFVEYFLVAWVYRRTPSLSGIRAPASANPSLDDTNHLRERGMRRTVRVLMDQVRLYRSSPAFLPSVSLSMLYLTVLSFSGQMITYLFAVEHPHLTSIHIGLLRTTATVLEISSTFVAPFLINHVGAVRAGMWSLSWQFFCLTPGIATFWTHDSVSAAPSIYLFIACVILSRIGLWSFDLSTQLLVQNSVDASQRGSFSATESSLQNFFELCTFVMTVIWSKPEQFKYPATTSLATTYVAAICYARFVRVERGHLLHMPSCCETIHTYKPLRDADEREDLEMSPLGET